MIHSQRLGWVSSGLVWQSLCPHWSAAWRWSRWCRYAPWSRELLHPHPLGGQPRIQSHTQQGFVKTILVLVILVYMYMYMCVRFGLNIPITIQKIKATSDQLLITGVWEHLWEKVWNNLKCLKRCAFQCIQTTLNVWKWGFVKSKKRLKSD